MHIVSRTITTPSADKACLMDSLPRLSTDPLMRHPFQQSCVRLSYDESLVCSPSWPSALLENDVFGATPKNFISSPIPIELPTLKPQPQPQPKRKTRDSYSTMSLDKFVDPTSFQVDFDYSCLNFLDEQLLRRPVESFAEMCYASTTIDDDDTPQPSGSSTPPVASADQFGVIHHGVLANLGYYDDSEDSDDDPTTPVFDTGYDSDGFSVSTKTWLRDLDAQDGEYFTHRVYEYYDDDEDDETDVLSVDQNSFILMGTSYKPRNPGDSVNYFPTAPGAIPRPKTRFASFCSGWPARLKLAST